MCMFRYQKMKLSTCITVYLLLTVASVSLVLGAQDVWCVYEKENLCMHCKKTYNVSMLANITASGMINTTLKFCSSVITFNEFSIFFLNSVNSVITSALNDTEVTCLTNSGFYMYNLTNVVIEAISLKHCGTAFLSLHSNDNTSASMFIENCFNVRLNSINISSSSGSALLMLDNRGNISIENCSFRNSSHHDHKTAKRAGAVFILFSTCGWKSFEQVHQRMMSNCTPFTITNTTLTISGSNFMDNRFALSSNHKVIGGGLSIITMKNSSRIKITVSNCLFINNTAYFGGGLHVVVKENSHDNHIMIERSNFTWNKCPLDSGGGVNVAHISYSENEIPQYNRVTFSGCYFMWNQAKFGAGLTIFSTSSPISCNSHNSIQFVNCLWMGNVAKVGDAVDIAPHNSETTATRNQLISVKFSNSTFSSAYNCSDRGSAHSSRGVVFVQEYVISFEGSTVFSHIIGSALYLVSSTAKFNSNSVVRFSNNDALSGGSLHIVGQSKITIKDASSFTFSNNRACGGGAAILQHSINPHEFVYSKSCFIDYVGINDVQKRGILFTFENNTDSCDGIGNSVHVTTFLPCDYKDKKHEDHCEPNFESDSSVFGCIANFSFSGVKEVSTEGKQLILLQNRSSNIITNPGREVELPVQLLDELNNRVSGNYRAQLHEERGDIRLDDAYTYTANNHIKLYGIPGSTASLLLVTDSARDVRIELNVTLQQCTPGYVIQSNNNARCICSLSANPDKQYKCIASCDEDNGAAFLEKNYWFGYDSNITECADITNTNSEFLYGFCPRGYCSNGNSSIQLTNNTSCPQDLNDEVCSANRRGRLCGLCKENYTAHYHSDSFECGDKETCKYGWILYILSEFIPVTLLFLIISTFNIKLTGGAINGFIYFAQTVNVIMIHTKYFHHSGFTETILHVHRSIVRIFNLNFFEHPHLSFCLIENAHILDMLMFRYLTTSYSLLLVLLMIAITHICLGKWIRMFQRKFTIRCSQSVKGRSTLIHGITGFLVLSYSECIGTSIKLLLPVVLYSKGHQQAHIAVWYNGELEYFRGRHLYYAIPSVLILATFGLIPPLLLISYPLCYKVLALLKLNETKFTRFICNCIPLEKMKPLFDSFQSSFKDKYRFFSGLYFVFRLVILAIQGTSDDPPNFYTGVQITSALVFALHVLCRPYKKKWHNILEGLFLLDLTLLAMTFTAAPSRLVVFMQITLLYFPIVFMVVYLGKTIWFAAKNCMICRQKHGEDIEYHEFTDSSIFMAAETRNQGT